MTYQVGREKIREYANALGIENPVHHDVGETHRAGFRDVVAPPMFAVVYSSPAVGPAILDPEVELNFAAMTTKVNSARDSINARPRIRAPRITLPAPGLRAMASAEEPRALPWASAQRPEASAIAIPDVMVMKGRSAEAAVS